MRRLYLLKKENTRIVCDVDVKSIRLSLRGLFIDHEKKNMRDFFVRFMWWLSTGGRARIFYIVENCVPVHTSYLIPRCNKFPFLGENDFEIGPCFTDYSARGKGYYPKVLDFIICQLPDNAEDIFMIVDDKNESSQKGVKKAGFVETDYWVKRSHMGRHIKIRISDKEDDI